MDARFLSQLAKIVECGSMRKAAEQLNVTQPTLSHNIRLLEDRVGTQLLRRTGKGVEPTLIGLQLAERGHEILACCGMAQQTVNIWHRGQDREFRLGISPIAEATLMSSFIEWSMSNAKLQPIRVKIGSPTQLLDLLEADQLDAVIAPTELSRHAQNLHHAVLMEDQMAVLARANHPAANLSGTALIEKLAEHNWMSVGASELDVMAPYFDQIGLERRPPALVVEGGISMVLEALHASDLIAALPSQITRFHSKGKMLRVLPVPVELPRRDTAIWVQMNNAETKFHLTFLAAVKAFVKAMHRSQIESVAGPV